MHDIMLAVRVFSHREWLPVADPPSETSALNNYSVLFCLTSLYYRR